jgi:CHASE2 domain-containing sensor protein
MAEPKLILIAAPELIPALRERVGDDDNVQTFADSETVRALEAISAQRPPVIALERLFAASPRGAALIARIKADHKLDASEIRILSHDTSYQRVSPRRRELPPPTVREKRTKTLDRGTRRAPRFRMREDAPAAIDDQPARLVDLSVVGVQLIGQEELRPKQQVSVRLGAGSPAIATAGTVVWARLELSRKGPTYRAGVDFIDPDRAAIGAYLKTHQER